VCVLVVMAIQAFVAPAVSGVGSSAVLAGSKVVAASRKAKVAVRRGPAVIRAEVDTTWDGKFPPSTVLGFGKDVPSPFYIFSSFVALVVGGYCCTQSNLISPLTPETVRPDFILGSLLVPISWGLHVAGWIQRQNNK